MTLRVALLCAGLDGATGGFETHMRTLHQGLQEDSSPIESRLFKSHGKPLPGEIVLRSPGRSSIIVLLLRRISRDRFFWESFFFSIFFLARVFIRREHFDRLVVIEPVVRRVVFPFARFLPGKPLVIWTHGLRNEPSGYVMDCDIVHEVNVENFGASVQHEPRSAKVVLLPHFCPDLEPVIIDRAKAREMLGIDTPFVLVAAGRIESATKRTDYIIEEASKLGNEWTLVLCGPPSEPELLVAAQQRMGSRLKHLVLPFERMPEVYAAADVLVHGSLDEGFGLVLIEAMRSGVPVVAHDRELFRWIIGDGGLVTDMREPGGLGRALEALEEAELERMGTQARRRFESTFSWTAVSSKYLAMLTGDDAGIASTPGTSRRLPVWQLVGRSRSKR